MNDRLEGGRIGEAGCNVGGLGVCLRARLRGTERVSSRGIGFEGGRVEDVRTEGGCRDVCRVDDVCTEGIGEAVAMVWEDVEAEPEGLGEYGGT